MMTMKTRAVKTTTTNTARLERCIARSFWLQLGCATPAGMNSAIERQSVGATLLPRARGCQEVCAPFTLMELRFVESPVAEAREVIERVTSGRIRTRKLFGVGGRDAEKDMRGFGGSGRLGSSHPFGQRSS
jgi:hypothetical protein